MLAISCFLVTAYWELADSARDAASKLRNRNEALTTTEWALLAAGAAAIAIAVVAVVRNRTSDAVHKIGTNVKTATTFASKS